MARTKAKRKPKLISYKCPKCKKQIWMTTEDELCTQCRIEAGLSPYEFTSVDIIPFENIFREVAGEQMAPDYNGFIIEWSARQFGENQTVEFWQENGVWKTDSENYPENFLEGAMEFFFANVENTKGQLENASEEKAS